MNLFLCIIALAAIAAILFVRALSGRAPKKKVVPAVAKPVEHKPVFGPYTPGHDPDEDKYWRRYY